MSIKPQSRVWLPEVVYKFFPAVVMIAGVSIMFISDTEPIQLLGIFAAVYGAGVLLLRA